MSRALLIVTFLFVGIVYSTKAQLDFQSLEPIPQLGHGWDAIPSDLDGDGDMDIVFSTRDNPRLYALFNSNGEFQSNPVPITPEFYTEPNSIYELTFDVSDFDNDGIDEIIYYNFAAEASTKRISVLKYNGQSFITIATLNTANSIATSIATGDVNKDGKMDIIYVSGEVYLLESSATGYVEKRIPTPQTSPFKLKISDIDGDTWPDLVIHDNTFKISIYKNNKNGSFDFNQHISSTMSLIKEMQIADFNNDGLNDIVVAGNSDQQYLDLFTQLNSGIFQSSKLNTLSSHYFGMDVGDFNHDTKIDIMTGGYVTDPITRHGISLLENTGTGFTPSFFSEPSLSPMNMKFADLDNDSNKEIVLMNFGKNIRLLDINSSQISLLKIIPFGNTFLHVTLKDLDNDGYDDLISSDPFGSYITILRNKGNGEYEDPQYYITDGMPSGVAAGDFNNDGYSDIIYSSNFTSPGSSILLSNQDGTLNDPIGISGSSSGIKIVLGDFNKDGNLDFYNGSLFFGVGDGTFIYGYSNLYNIYDYEAQDFNNDGYTDLVAVSPSGLSIAHGQNSYELTLVQNIATDKLISSVTSGELSNDTYTDFLVIYNDGTTSVFANSSIETFTETPITTVQGISSKAVINDFDKDGLNDFALLVGNKKVVLYTPSPGGTFKLLNTYSTDPWYYDQLLLSNQNGDSDLDILVLSNNGLMAYLLNDLVKEPTLFPSNLNATEITDTSLTLSLDKGDGDGRIVVIREESTSSFLPVDNEIYIPNAKFGAGYVSAGNYVVMADNSTGVTISGLKENTSYAITAFEYSSNEGKTIINYFIGALENITITTLKSQTITPLTISNKLVSDIPFTFSATSTSNLPVTIELISGGVTFTNGTISIQQAGPVKFKLTQPGNDEFAAATIEYTFCVNPPIPSISYTALQNNKFQLTSSSTTNNKWLKNDLEITSANSQTLEVEPDGIYKVKVDYDGCYNSSTSISNQSIVFPDISTKEEGQSDFIITATASSTLPLLLEIVSGGILITNSTVKINTPGPAKIKATQAGNSSFFPAASVEKTFCVNPKTPTITTTSTGIGEFILTSSSDINNQWLRNSVPISGATNKTFEPTDHGMYIVKVDYSGCSNSSLPTTFLILGIDENLHTTSSLYPNPASDKLFIEWPAQNPKIDKVLFHDSQGKQFIVNYAYREDLISMDIHNLVPGLYTILLQTTNGPVVRKVIKN